MADGLYFPNGVAVAEDDSFVLVVETINISVKRFWLKGPKVPPFGWSLPLMIDRLSLVPEGEDKRLISCFRPCSITIIWLALEGSRWQHIDLVTPAIG